MIVDATNAHLAAFDQPDRQAERDRLEALEPVERILAIGLAVGGGLVQEGAGEGGEEGGRLQQGAEDRPAPENPVTRAQEEAAKRVSRVLSRAPKYSGLRQDTPWRTWLLAFQTWSTLAGLEHCEPEFQKSILYSLLEASALERARIFGPSTQIWRNCAGYKPLLALLSECYQPKREQGFIRVEWEGRIQGHKEPVYDYLASKLSLYHEAYGDDPTTQLPFSSVKETVIRGLAMPNLRRAVFRLDPQNEAELHAYILRACSDEAILWSMGASESSSLTGIGPISHPMKSSIKNFGGRGSGPNPKPHGKGRGAAEKSFPKGSCFGCGSFDHWVSDCKANANSAPKPPKPQVAAAGHRGGRGRGRGGNRGGRSRGRARGRGGRGGRGGSGVRNVGEEVEGEADQGTPDEQVSQLGHPHQFQDQWSSSDSD